MATLGIDLNAALQAAVEAAQSAGSIMRECYKLRYAEQAQAAASASGCSQHLVDLDIDEKTAPTDLVTKYDKQCDETIMARLRLHSAVQQNNTPFQFITEEICPDAALTDDPTWIVDPIDGTMSFVHLGYDCCVSIGLAIGRKPVLGVVYCPFLGSKKAKCDGNEPADDGDSCSGELYTAIEGQGAFLNGKPISVRKTDRSRAVALFNMPWRMTLPAINSSVQIRQELALSQFHAIRSYGACVLQLAQVAAGRAELYMEPGGKMWDVCAGAVLVQEAGGCVLALEGNPFTLDEHTITVGATRELAEFGSSLCKKFNYRKAYYAD